jgi:hypothetical protein
MLISKKIIILIKLFGFFCIIIATISATVIIPSFNQNILQIQDYIERIENKINRGILFYIDYKQTELKNRINHLDRNNLILNNLSGDSLLEIENRILDSELFLIEMWSKLYLMDDITSEDFLNVNRSEDIIYSNQSFGYRINELQNILEETKLVANERLQLIQDTKGKSKIEMSELKLKKQFYSIIFIWSQIIGLIAISLSDTIIYLRSLKE